MEWSDEAVILSARRHGEAALVVNVLTPSQGRHAGLVPGGAGSKRRATYQPGNIVQARWRARLADHLGTLTCEPVTTLSALCLDDAERLTALTAVCALTEACLPERLPMPELHDAVVGLLSAIAADIPDWRVRYVRWELGLLAALGYGLDLSACAVTGETENLAYVSPRSGRAVSEDGAGPYRERLLPLPAVLLGGDNAETADLVAALTTTGHFLERHVLSLMDKPLPDARHRLLTRWRQ